MVLSNKITQYVFILFVLFLTGCVKYSFKGALPAYLKTIAIPAFKDQSAWVGLQEQLTQKVVEAFVQDNTLKVVDDEKEVDLLLLKGTIISVQNRKTSITQEEVVEAEQMVVTVKIECLNTHTNKPLWSGNVSQFSAISAAASLQERDEAVGQAVDRIVLEILNSTIAAW